MGRLAHAALAAALLAAMAGPLSAQRARPGWIGVFLDIPSAGDSMVIAEVRRGSPAEEAGLRAGDRLLSVGNLVGADDFRDMPQALRLNEGQRVRVRVERGGRPLEFVVQAAARPGDVRTGPVGLSVETDSMVETMVKAMDSLRARLIQVRGGDRSRPADPSDDSRSGTLRIVRDDRPTSVGMPFEFFVFRSEAHDSLERAMEDLRRLNDDLRRQEQRRVAELRTAIANLDDLDVDDAENDRELQVLRAALEEVTHRSAQIRAAMSEAAKASAGANYTLPSWSSPVPFWAPSGDPGPEQPDAPTTFRPLTPYLLGSNMVAGAQVIDLRPELARYFDVAGGVLVVDVAPGTPAALSGMTPGDVITRLDQVAIRSVEELRFGVSRARDSLPVSLVRHGSTLEVLLRR